MNFICYLHKHILIFVILLDILFFTTNNSKCTTALVTIIQKIGGYCIVSIIQHDINKNDTFRL